jgi:tRNA dimethylallyltransferase
MQQKDYTVIVICGPTAVGKTSFAVQLAHALHTEIISADSRQCFKELNIGVSKPSAQQLEAVPHHFINSHCVTDEVNAAVFEAYALHAVDKIFERQKVAVMVGGTGLYIKAFCEGMDEIPPVTEEVRQGVIKMYEEKGITSLQSELAGKDLKFWQMAEQQNPYRLMRALEVLRSTGRSITEFRKGKKVERPFKVAKLGLELPRVQLYNKINYRVDEMIAHGLVDEVTGLRKFRDLNALQTVGYNELFDYLDNKTSLDEAINSIKINTRRYAKRQLTWFKKDTDITWVDANNTKVEFAKQLL